MVANIGVSGVVRILKNSSVQIVGTLFMLTVSYAAYTKGYTIAATFFLLIAAAVGTTLYKKVSSELIRERFRYDYDGKEPTN